jgi:hypothetical protein
MTGGAMDSDFQARAAEHKARIRATWRDTNLFAALSGALLVIAYFAGPGPFRIVLIGVAAAAGAVALVRGTLHYIRSVDEQERDANLWGCYVGMCVYLVLFPLDQAARAFGVAIPHADWGIFILTLTAVLGVFAWLRFR